jgi:hypothetical protein
MPANAALIAVLLVERPTCVNCISERAGVLVEEARRYLREIGTSLDVVLDLNERCRTCGGVGPAYSVRRAAG